MTRQAPSRPPYSVSSQSEGELDFHNRDGWGRDHISRH